MFFRISWPGENPAKFLFLKLNPSIDYGQTDAGASVFLAAVQALEGAIQLTVLQRKRAFATEV